MSAQRLQLQQHWSQMTEIASWTMMLKMIHRLLLLLLMKKRAWLVFAA